MPKSYAQVDIRINGLQNINQMEEELAKMNEEIRNLDKGSQAWKDMARGIATVQDRLKGMNSQMEGVTSTEKAEGILKMGEGFAGALIGIQGLQSALGGTSEELEIVVQRVGGLILAMDGLRRVTEAFSAENMKRLRGVGRGYQRLVMQVKAASAAMKTALISTGIGALVVAVGLLIANWEKLTTLVTNGKRKRELEKEIEANKRLSTDQEAKLEGWQKEAELRKQIAEYNNDFTAAARAQLNALSQASALAANRRNDAKLELELAEMALDKQVKRNGKFKKGYQEQLEAVSALKAELISVDSEYDVQARLLDEAMARWEIIAELTNFEDQQKSIADMVKALGGVEFTTKQIYNLNLQNNKLQIRALELTKETQGYLSKTQQQQLDTLKAERQALIQTEQLRRKNLDLAIEELDRGKEYEANIRVINEDLAANQIILEKQLGIYEELQQENEALAEAKARELELQQYIAAEQARMFPFDQKGLEILKEKLGLIDTERVLGGEIEGISVDVSKISQTILIQYQQRVDAMNQTYEAQKDVLDAEKEVVAEQQAYLEVTKDNIAAIEELANARIQVLAIEQEGYDNAAEAAKNDEEKFYWLQKSQKVQDEIVTLQDEALNASNEISILDNEINIQLSEQKRIATDMLAIEQERKTETALITYELEQQARLSSRMKEFVSQYNDEIQAGIDIVNAWFEHAAAQYDELARKAEEKLKKAQKELDRLNKKQEKSSDRLKDLQDELKDADGERYNELLDLIKQEQDLRDEGGVKIEEQILAQQELEKQAINEKMKAEYEKAKMEKRQAIINAAINTALAVIKALPNIILAAAVGIAGGIGIATIAAQKIPVPEYLAKGTESAKGGLAIVGEEGKELVSLPVGAKVYKHSDTLEYLSGMKPIPAFATGGSMTPEIVTAQQQEFLDYKRLSDAILMGIQPKVAVVDIITGINKVKVIQSNASL